MLFKSARTALRQRRSKLKTRQIKENSGLRKVTILPIARTKKFLASDAALNKKINRDKEAVFQNSGGKNFAWADQDIRGKFNRNRSYLKNSLAYFTLFLDLSSLVLLS